MEKNSKTSKEIAKRIKRMAKGKNAKAVSLPFLIGKLFEVSEGSHTKGFLIMASEPSGFRKTNNPFFGRVKKLTGFGFDLNTDYTTKVNNQLEREGKENDFVAKKTYTIPINKVIHKHVSDDRLYLQAFPAPNFGTFSTYIVDGRNATAEETAQIKSFLPAKPTDSGRQGTDKKIEIRKPLLSNILIISVAGERFFIKDNVEQLKEA